MCIGTIKLPFNTDYRDCITCSLRCTTCVSKSLSLFPEELGAAFFADDGRDDVEPGFAIGLDLAAPGKQRNYTIINCIK